jgi:hypothetical protein
VIPKHPPLHDWQAALVIGITMWVCVMFVSKGFTGNFKPLPAAIAGVCSALLALWLFL